jgi:hypothetical protein
MLEKGLVMLRSFSSCLLAFALVSSTVYAAAAEPRSGHQSASKFTISMSRTSLRKLIEKGDFDGGHRVRALPIESVRFGKSELWLARPGREFKNVSEIVGYLNSIGLEPVGYRELLEFTIQEPKILADGETVYALGSPAAFMNGTVSWQCVGLKDGRRFVSDTVEGEGWPANAFYLAKRKSK